MKITVFTPTYNRAYIIEKLYCSLQRQSFRDFEWLVVDDGSSDNTSDLFMKWQLEDNFFTIRYYTQPNGGKCRAINRGVQLAEGELFFTVDSDDYLTYDALEKIVLWESQLPDNQKYCGVAGNLGTSADYTPNKLFADGCFDGTLLDRYTECNGERAIVIYTDIHRKYLYPEFDGEKFMTEAVVWNRIAHDGYRMRFYNDIIWIYEYKADGLTRAGNQLFLNNPRGYWLWRKELIQFTGGSMKERFLLYYCLVCELSDKYTALEISSIIQTGIPVVKFVLLIHALKQLFRRGNKNETE